MTLMSEMTCDQLKDLLGEAETAYHDLILGTKARVIIDSNGERVEFTTTNRANLYAYVQELRSQVDRKCGTSICTRNPTGPAGFLF